MSLVIVVILFLLCDPWGLRGGEASRGKERQVEETVGTSTPVASFRGIVPRSRVQRSGRLHARRDLVGGSTCTGARHIAAPSSHDAVTSPRGHYQPRRLLPAPFDRPHSAAHQQPIWWVSHGLLHLYRFGYYGRLGIPSRLRLGSKRSRSRPMGLTFLDLSRNPSAEGDGSSSSSRKKRPHR